jgi:hypothetical protein
LRKEQMSRLAVPVASAILSPLNIHTQHNSAE